MLQNGILNSSMNKLKRDGTTHFTELENNIGKLEMQIARLNSKNRGQ